MSTVLDRLGFRSRPGPLGPVLELSVACRPEDRIGDLSVQDICSDLRSLVSRMGGTPGPILALDLETTGLRGGAGCVAFLVGTAIVSDSNVTVRQFLLDDYPSEPALLAAVSELVKDIGTLVTFNGRRFDWPLLTGRYPLQRLPVPAEPPHLDLLHPARRIWGRRLASCRLEALERELLGVRRHHDVPSHLIPGLYFDFLNSGLESLLYPVVEHNRQDLLSLLALGAVVGQRLQAPAGPAADVAGTGMLLESLGDLELSMKCYRRAASDLPEAAARLFRLHRRRGDYERAAAVCRELIERRPDLVWPYVELAKHCEHRLKDYGRAREYVERALELTQDPSACGSLRHRLARLGRKKQHMST